MKICTPSPSFILIVTVLHFHLSNSIVQIQHAVLDDYYKSPRAVEAPIEAVYDHMTGWELYVVNDLMFQISLKMCPKVNRPTASFLKDFITQSLKTTQRNQPQNVEFFPTYSKLMDCFDYMQSISKNPGKKLEESVTFVDDGKKDHNQEKGKDHSTKLVKKMSEGSLNPPSENDKQVLNHAWLDPEGKWHFHWIKKVSDMVSSVFREKRFAEDLNESVQDEEIRKDSQAKHKFSGLLNDITKIVRRSCPAEMKISSSFTKTIVKDLMYSVSRDVHSLTSTALKYFKSNSILDEMNACLQNL